MPRNSPRRSVNTKLILDLWKQGMPLTHIARDAHCNVATVRHRLRAAGEDLSTVRNGRPRKTGLYQNRKGYFYLSCDAIGYIDPTHQCVVSQRALVELGLLNGCRLLDCFVIHHMDEHPDNNHPNNLVILTKSEHRKLHNGKPVDPWACHTANLAEARRALEAICRVSFQWRDTIEELYYSWVHRFSTSTGVQFS